MFYAPQSPEFLKSERAKARELKKSNWWQAKINEGLCYYCHKSFLPSELTMDHRVPLAHGGVSSKNNIVPCCKPCNVRKQSQNSIDFVY